MNPVKLIFLFVVITMMQFHGVIYRTGVKKSEIRNLRDQTEAKSGAGRLRGSWRLYGISELDETQEGGLMGVKQADNHGLILSFFEDSTFTQVSADGGYKQGKWAFDDSTASLYLTSNRKTQEISVSFDRTPQGSRMIIFEFSPESSMSLIRYAPGILSYREDPFYAANNKWRLKPDAPENPAQLKARLVNYIIHNAYLLKAAQERQQNYISWEFSEGIIKLYNVGIGVVRVDKIPVSWSNNFYSPENALQAHAIFENYIRTGKHRKSNTGNWVKDDYNILIDIHNHIGK